MKVSGDLFATPLYLKLSEEFDWPENEPIFYLLAKDGMYLCRNSQFGRSCAPTDKVPRELADQKPFFKTNYPKLAKVLFERVVGFFDLIDEEHDSESAALIVYNSITGKAEIVIPDQAGLYSYTPRAGEKPYCMDMEYETPVLPPHLRVIGDIHSHCNFSAYSSFTDEKDEEHRPGIHIIVGCLRREPPDISCDIVVDGHRFKVTDLNMVVEGYDKRRKDEVPPEWFQHFTTKKKTWTYSSCSSSSTDKGKRKKRSRQDHQRDKLHREYYGGYHD